MITWLAIIIIDKLNFDNDDFVRIIEALWISWDIIEALHLFYEKDDEA